MSTARGQITITDLNDAKQTAFYLDPSVKSHTQVYNKSGMTYSPDFVKTNNVITPVLYVTGESDNKMTSADKAPVWTVYQNNTVIFCNSSDTEKAKANSNFVVGTAAPYTLTIKMNIPNGADQFYISCETSYYDSSIQQSIPQSASLTLTKNVNSGTLAFADIRPSCEVFHNGTDPASITLTPVLNRGGAEDITPGGGDDGTFSVVWFKDGTADSNKITAVSGKYAIDSTTQVLTVYPGGVDNVNTFFAKITDTNAKSATNGKSYIASQTLTDLTDPYRVEIVSDRGTQFKNGKGSNITLTANLKQGADDVPAKVASYNWSVVNRDGSAVSLTGKTTNKQTFVVEPSMVSGTAMVTCEITIK